MAIKKYDLVVKIGEYQSGGQTKARWETIGSIMTDVNGGQYMFLKRSFNPAGVPFKEDSDSIMVSLFEPKPNGSSQQSEVRSPETSEEIPF